MIASSGTAGPPRPVAASPARLSRVVLSHVPDLDAIWPPIQAELRDAVTDSAYHLWLEPLRPLALDGDVLRVAAPDEIRSWVGERFGRVLQVCAAVVLGPEVTVELTPPAEGAASGRAASKRAAASSGTAFNPRYTFEQFVIGEGNRLAHAASLAVAELPAQAYNPLFIYGPPGNGKTHLLHAIGNYLTSFGEGLSVHYTTIEDFTNHFVTAIQSRSTESFKAAYRDNDVLLIDDVQVLESKVKTEEEFFHTFNALYDTGAQLVITSDRPPRDLLELAGRLRERFECGLVTDIQPPDRATRLTILRKRAQHDKLCIDEATLAVVADRITASIRALEGALIRIVAFHSLTSRPIDPALAEEVLEGLYPGRRPPARTVRDIQAAVCETLGVSLDELLSAGRTRRVAEARHLAMYLARELTDTTLPAIGREFGGRNHSTVLNGHRRTTTRMSTDPATYELVQLLTRRLQGDDDRSA